MTGRRGFPAVLVLVAASLFAWLGWQREPTPAPEIEAVDGEAIRPVLLVGIDGATFDLIDPLVEDGRLPNLSRLIRDGTSARLATEEPTVSPAIWTTIATGKRPQRHGIDGFDGVPGRTMTTLPTSQMREVRAFWNMLSEHGRSVGVVGWWATWPAENVEGYVVSDRVPYMRMEATIGAEGKKEFEVFPAELAGEVRSRVRRPDEIEAADLEPFVGASDEEFERRIRDAEYAHGNLLPELKYVHQSDLSTADIATHLLRTRPTDVTAVAFYGVDVVSHLAWHFMEPEKFSGYRIPEEAIERLGGLIEAYYVFVDTLLGRLLEAAGDETTVIVFSDHGFGATGKLPWSGGHGRITPGAPVAPDGILVLHGAPFRSGVRLDEAHVLDVTPTLLQLQGLPVADDMPGRVLEDALRERFRASVPLRRVPTYEVEPLRRDAPLRADPETDRALMEKLRSLGYVE